MFEQLKLPGAQIKAPIVESRRKDIEALAQANQVALKGVASIADKQAEFLQTVMADVAAKLKSASEGGASSATAMDLAKQSVDKALAAMRHLADNDHQIAVGGYRPHQCARQGEPRGDPARNSRCEARCAAALLICAKSSRSAAPVNVCADLARKAVSVSGRDLALRYDRKDKLLGVLRPARGRSRR